LGRARSLLEEEHLRKEDFEVHASHLLLFESARLRRAYSHPCLPVRVLIICISLLLCCLWHKVAEHSAVTATTIGDDGNIEIDGAKHTE